MHPTLAFAIGSVAAVILVCTGIVLFLRRRTAPTPAPTSPTPTAVTSPVQYALFDPMIEDWEVQAPYPDHARHGVRHAPSASSRTSDYPTRRSLDPFPDVGEPFESEPCRRGFESPAYDEPLESPSSRSAKPRPSAAPVAEPDHFSYAPSWSTEAPGSSSDAHHHCGSTRVERSTSAGKQAVRVAASLVQPAVSQWRYPVPRLAQPSAPLEARSVSYSMD